MHWSRGQEDCLFQEDGRIVPRFFQVLFSSCTSIAEYNFQIRKRAFKLFCVDSLVFLFGPQQRWMLL